jgi:uncharacterized protein (TIGR03437 family)
MKSIRVACLWAVAAATLVYAQPTITSVVDPYTGGTKLAPGGQAVITGTNLAGGGVVTVGGVNAFTLAPPQGGPTETIQIPVNAAVGSTVPVVVTTGAGASAPFNITLTQYAPVLIGATSGALTSPRHGNGVGITAATPAAPGESITFYAIGLGPTNPAVNTGQLAANTTTATTTTPTVTFGANAAVNATVSRLANGQGLFGANGTTGPAGSSQALIGIYLVSTTVPSGTATGSYPVTISIGGATSNSVNVAVGPVPTGPVISAIVGETGKTALCPGDVAILSGLNLGTSPTVTVGGKTAFNINPPNSGNQMTIEIPVDAALGNANVVLTLGTGTASAPFAITLTQYAPVIPINGGTNPPFHLSSGTSVTAASPAVPGEQVGVIAYGLGPTNPVVPTGGAVPSNPNPSTVTTPTVNVGGTTITSGVSAGLSNGQTGLYFVIFTVPQNQPAGNAPVSISLGGLTSNLTTLNVFTGPAISTVTNAASNITAGLPNAGIAQGSIFTLFGTNLGPAAISVAPAAFQSTSLSGTSISVTVSGTTVAALMYYTSATQVSALLPSNTPTGTGTITVTYNGQVGLAAPITVVANNLGIFTYSQDGQGAAIVTNPNYTLVSVTPAANCGAALTTCGAANPGDTLVLWATGLGPVSNDAEVGVPISVALTVWLGGVQANVSYQGRGCCEGEDQINFTVPDNAPTGCAVPLAVQIGTEISNYTVVPIAPKGTRTCTASNSTLSSNDVQLLTTSSGTFTHGEVGLSRQPNINAQGQVTGNTDYGKAQFLDFTVPAALQPFMVSYLDDLPPGACAVYNNLNGGNNGGNYLNFVGSLDAGANIQVTGPNGNQTIPANRNGQTTLSAAATYLSPGAYTISGSGGANVGAFSQAYTIPPPPTLTSPASGVNINVTRANGMTLTWSGGSANYVIQIQGSNATDATQTKGANFTCFVSASAGTFTIPPSVLLALPPGNFGGMNFQPYSLYGTFTASGLNHSAIQMNYQTPIFTTLQ